MPENPRQRVRFDAVEHEVFPDGRGRVTVRLEWRGRVLEATSEGTQPLPGALRTAATATLKAAVQAADGRIRLSLVGVKTIRAFDESIVVVAVRGHAEDGDHRLLGVKALKEDDPVEASVRATLSAVNRVLARYVGEEEAGPDGAGPA